MCRRPQLMHHPTGAARDHLMMAPCRSPPTEATVERSTRPGATDAAWWIESSVGAILFVTIAITPSVERATTHAAIESPVASGAMKVARTPGSGASGGLKRRHLTRLSYCVFDGLIGRCGSSWRGRDGTVERWRRLRFFGVQEWSGARRVFWRPCACGGG